MNLPANISTANLPRTYEAAREALAECARIDECQEWADRASALASYARQAEDDTLEAYAKRIKGRAVRRAGELLKQVEPQQGGDRRSDQRAGGHPMVSRASAAREAGMSPHQAKQAIRVANVPDEDFESQIESDAPPTLSQLAQQGIKPRPIVDLGGRDPKAFNKALHFLGDLENAAKDLEAIRTQEVIPSLEPDERAKARALVARIDAVCDRIATRIQP